MLSKENLMKAEAAASSRQTWAILRVFKENRNKFCSIKMSQQRKCNPSGGCRCFSAEGFRQVYETVRFE
jgi:hypothetical protein